MAKLPDTYGRRPTPQSRTQIASDQSGQIIGQAITRFGTALEARQARQDRFAYAQAKASLLTADLDARRELEDDDDWATYEKRYREHLKKARDQANNLITSEEDRALFDSESTIAIERGATAIRAKAKVREVSWGRADLAERLEKIREAALNAEDEPSRTALVQTATDLIDGARDRDYIDEVAAVRMGRAWTESYAKGYLDVQSPARRLEILKNPKGTPAEYLKTDVRATLKEAAEKENNTLRIRQDSQAQADRLFDQFEKRGDALGAARDIGDPEVRDATVQRLRSRYTERDALQATERKERFERASNLIEQGGKIEDIKAQDWAGLAVTQRQSLEKRHRQVQTGVEPVMDYGKYYEWSLLSPEVKISENLMSYRPHVDNPTFMRMVHEQTALRAAAAGDQDAAARVTSTRSDTKRIEQSLVSAGVIKEKPTASDSPKVKQRYALMENELMNRIEEASQAVGRKLTPTERQDIIEQSIAERVFVDDNWIFADPDKPIVGLTEQDIRRAYVPLSQIPSDDLSALRNRANSLGLSPSQRDLERAYGAAVAGLGRDEVDNRLRGR